MPEKLDIKTNIRDIIAELQEMDQRMREWSESLPLPDEADDMWEGKIPTTVPVNLYAAIEAVRSSCIQEAIEKLDDSLLVTDESLRQQFLQARKSDKGGVTFEFQQHPGEAGKKETPPCSD